MLLVVVASLLVAWSAILTGIVVYMKYKFRWKHEYRVFIEPNTSPTEIIVSKQGKLVEYGHLSNVETIIYKHLFNNVKNRDNEVES